MMAAKKDAKYVVLPGKVCSHGGASWKEGAVLTEAVDLPREAALFHLEKGTIRQFEPEIDAGKEMPDGAG